jgi:hypothetical protein
VRCVPSPPRKKEGSEIRGRLNIVRRGVEGAETFCGEV